MSSVIYTGVVLIANLKVVLDTSFHEVISITCVVLGILAYFISVFLYSKDYIFSEEVVINSYILDNITMIVFNSKYFLCLFGSVTMCYFLEIVCEKYPILFGCVIEGKNLPPFKEKIDNEIYKKYYKNDYEVLELLDLN